MRKSPFSYESIREVYDRENRKGRIDLTLLPTKYCDVIHSIQDIREEFQKLKKISIKKMDKDAKDAYHTLLNTMHDETKRLHELKDLCLKEILLNVERHLNARTYRYEIKRDERFYSKTGKESFHTKGDSLEALIMSKLLCIDLSTAFKVKTSNRHHIMACLKGLLVPDRPFMIVRTDIKNFFESIPHDLILSLVTENMLVDRKTEGCLRSVLAQYDRIKSEGKHGIGVPRGVAISSYVSEIVMRDFDMRIQKLPNVMFYARYVDDIIIVLSHLPSGTSLDSFFSAICSAIERKGLQLHPKGSSKSYFIDYSPNRSESNTMEYLGYKIQFNQKDITFHLSNKRYQRIKSRLDNAFHHFESSYRRNPRKARVDLIDCLNLLSGNTSLHKSKNGVKTGLFFSNDLISNDSKQLSQIQSYYINAKVNRLNLDEKPFGNTALKDAYQKRLTNKLQAIDFPKRWKNMAMYSFSVKRLKELSRILGE